MNPLNAIHVEGNLVRDPELRETPKGTPVCTFAVATNRVYFQEDERRQEVSFFDVETWSNTAERCAKTLQKGRGVRVNGRLKQDRWEDAEGKPHSRIKIVADKVEFRTVFSGDGDGEEAEGDEPMEAVNEEETFDEGQHYLAEAF